MASLPAINFGSGVISHLPAIIQRYGVNVLLVTGATSFDNIPAVKRFLLECDKSSINIHRVKVSTEPSPQLVDSICTEFRHLEVDVVVGFGGGSALDAAKAIAGLIKTDHSVMDFLEGVGPELNYPGPVIPFIAVPTTAGTGSEATKNAVLSHIDANGFKKSFRDDQLVANIAVVDPDLLKTCPPQVIAGNGMDALTQLIESFVSIRSNIFNNSLGEKALACVRDGLLPLYHSEGADAMARKNMAYASLVSGVNLAQTGLGSVHGLASPLGAYFPIPHGEVCGTLIAEATEINILAMLQREPDNPALGRYQYIVEILLEQSNMSRNQSLEALVSLLRKWVLELRLPTLDYYGLTTTDIDKVVKNSRGSSMQTNPIVLTDDEIRQILLRRLAT